MVQVPDRKEQLIALAAGGDPTRLKLSAAEGYLLSRIDGATSWRLLREIGGIPPESVDDCLSRWLEEGLLEVIETTAKTKTQKSHAAAPKSETPGKNCAGASEAAATDAAEVPKDAPFVPSIDESALDESLDITLEVQRRILEFESSLELPYHQLLGVKQGAEPKTVKRAYFKLSKEFHPDRYFRKSIGGYGDRLSRIFKRVLEAHEILSDPELAQVAFQPTIESTESVEPPVPEVNVQADAASAVPKSAKARTSRPKPLTKLERLRQRMPFKIDHAAIADRRARAAEIFRAAMQSQQAGKFKECEQSLRIAITFDPGRAEFKEALGSLRIAAAGARASKLLASPSDRMSEAELREALRLIEEVLPYRPHDPELNERAARICVQLGKPEDAQEYAETLVERLPESAEAHALLGKIHKQQGDLDKAVAAFEMALKYDKENLEARRAIAAVRIGARDLARGGTQ